VCIYKYIYNIRIYYLFILQNRGIYMFRLDEERVVDATLCGGLARYINHSCNPNCVAEIVEVERDLRIIIFAKRRISRGEEVIVVSLRKIRHCLFQYYFPYLNHVHLHKFLSLKFFKYTILIFSYCYVIFIHLLLQLAYDYKFDIEDDQHKIACACGAPNCRKWMN